MFAENRMNVHSYSYRILAQLLADERFAPALPGVLAAML
jgi:hypothetical protein